MLFREFVRKLEKDGMMVREDREVDPVLQITKLIRSHGDRPIIFSNLKGSEIGVVSNICSSRKLLSMGLGIKEKDLLKAIMRSIDEPTRPRVKDKDGYTEMECNLNLLPIPKFYSSDGGRYITSGVAVIDDEEYGLNASYHRAMVIGRDRIVMRILPRDFHRYIERGNLEFAFCIGNPVSVMISSAISVEIEKSELDIANSLYPIDLIDFDGILAPEAEIVMVCRITGESAKEGPFVDITQTLDLVRDQPVAKIERIFVKPDPLFHAILPAGYEHRLLMGLPREVTIFKEVSKVCDVVDVRLTPGGCSWLHAVVKIRKRKPDDPRNAIDHAFKGHSSLKHVFVVDEDIDIEDPESIEWAFATRFQGDRDMIMKRERGSSLDPSADPKTRETTKMGFDLTIPMDRERRYFERVEE